MFLPVPHHIHNNTFWLSPERCIYWEQGHALIVSDLHLGKTGHFRKAGIAVPQTVFQHDLQRLFHLIQHYRAQQLIIVGDLFHSKENKEMELFIRWRESLSQVAFTLVKGNHDILPPQWYTQAGIVTHAEEYSMGGFCFTHDPAGCSAIDKEVYTFSGHIHPGIRLNGLAKQSLQFPCYYFGETYAILPAFSRFTGLAGIQPNRNDHVFAIVNQSVIPIQC